MVAKKKSKAKKEPVSERVLEARREFDEALEKIKSRGSRRRYDPTDPVVLFIFKVLC